MDYLEYRDTLFWAKVDKEIQAPCWIWTGATNGYWGYGRLRMHYPRRMIYAHRYAFEIFNGEIKPGMQIDHLCRVVLCVNPDHLEEVTPSVNAQRAYKPRPQ